ncbi:enoyl-CoA hydratase [Cladophialophora yegresii CBS 114405]|uniref:Enoyl-CoA hydratase n=1 Tax=Cladophialophora yegresii CBS 114405 TaxID=1182544 RepID=W9WF09_9EURO|nr:enoyl-CoA hydratase [Cladophialophora yegresii CBS 114405]EXJ63161.1 enoyl-CoA hydratase [Cladophialophora yegresii CBS 114405]
MANVASPEEAVLYREQGRIAIITLNLPKKLNAMTQQYYYRISCLLRDIAENPAISVTVITGSGRFFSAGANVTSTRPGVGPDMDKDAARNDILKGFVANNLDITRSFYAHPKVLIGALNGPTVGLSAALLGFCDFIYAAPHTFLLTPFSSLGLVAEGGASYGLVQRMGISKANEALIMSRKIPCDELVACGFVNKVFSGKDQNDSDGFLKQVLAEVEDKLGDHLNQESIVKIKQLVRAPYLESMEAQGVREVMEGMKRFVVGAPQEEFKKIASGQKRHKL